MSTRPQNMPFPVLPLPAATSPPAYSRLPLRPDPSSYSYSPPAALVMPEQLTTFSYDDKHVLRHDDSSIRFFVEPPENAFLEEGFERRIEKEEDSGRLDSLLEAYMRVENAGKRHAENVDVMTWRGMMTRLVTSLYEERDSWEMNAMLVNGTLYLEDNVTTERLRAKQMPPFHQKLAYTGLAFESFCTTSRLPPSVAPQGWSGDVNTNLQWCSIIETAIGSSRIIIGGEVDCVRGPYTGKTGNYVELKTTSAIVNDRDRQNFGRKVLKYWAQSYLLGIPEVVVGFRTPHPPYHLQSFQTFQTWRLPNFGVRSGWSASACLNWTNAVLHYLRTRIAEQGQGSYTADPKVYRVAFTPHVGINVRPLSSQEIGEIETKDPVPRVGFLPRAYWDWLMSRSLTYK